MFLLDSGSDGQRQIQRGGTTQLASVFFVIKGTGSVHGGSVIPDDKITWLPFMAIGKFALCCVFNQIAK
jgi:hypothetical protein